MSIQLARPYTHDREDLNTVHRIGITPHLGDELIDGTNSMRCSVAVQTSQLNGMRAHSAIPYCSRWRGSSRMVQSVVLITEGTRTPQIWRPRDAA